MNSIVHFEIHASDPEKMASFYRDVFGWDIKKWEGGSMDYWLVMTAAKDAPNAINGGLVRRQGPAPGLGAPVNAFVCTLQVEDIDAMMDKAVAHGAKVALPKMAIPGMAWQGYLLDPEHNIFGIHQADPDAK
jgi:predicted enzyme related to lactoylglutathione lyase